MAGELVSHPRELPYARRWLTSMLPGHNPLQDELPWITFRAIDWLNDFLRPSMCVFEFGAGGSTLFLAKRASQIWSVEHDESFYEIVQKRLDGLSQQSCELMLRKPVPCLDRSVEFASYQDRYKGMCFESYVKSIDRRPDRSLDLVLVDGRARLACVRRAVPKVKPGGVIMLDNSDRPSYAEAADLLSGFERLDLAGLTPWNMEASQTSIWRLPA
jgi:predicted O-methyltransferase YrrM